MFKSRSLGRNYGLLFWILCCIGLLPFFNLVSTQAEALALPAVTYDGASNTITIGSSSGAPTASQVITFAELVTALANQGKANLLVNQGSGNWLLKANVVVATTAQLTVTQTSVTWLRLDSPPLKPVTMTAFRGGYLLFDGVKITSWDSAANAVDTDIADQRSYLLALQGGRMDILNSDVGYLGWENGEASGLSWRERLNPTIVNTGATGRLEDSQIHDNYFGMYSFAAYGLTILRNQVFNNLHYGIDPHDDSEGFEVAFNKVYGNGTHGIIFSRQCQNNVIHDNEVHDNLQHGIMLDRGSDHNVIRDNLIYNNQDGIAIFESSDNQIFKNTVKSNVRGIRINATYDTNDVYDGISAHNQVSDNLFQDSQEYGVYLYARADQNTFTGNTILRSGVAGVYLKSGGNRFENNLIRDGVLGISIVGGDVLNLPAGAVPPLNTPGNNNVVISNTVVSNSDVGIRVLGGSDNQIGSENLAENGNRIENNGRDGLAIGDATTGTASTGNQIVRNVIRFNIRHGVLVKDASSVHNRISRNSITGNGWLGIKIETGAQGGIQPPAILSTPSNGLISGTAQPNVTVEVYSDATGSEQAALGAVAAAAFAQSIDTVMQPTAISAEGATYLGSATAAANGNWSFQLPPNQNAAQINTLAIDNQGNTSAFTKADANSGGGGGTPVYTMITDDNGQSTIQVTGLGATVSITDVQAGLSAGNQSLVQNLGNGVWRLNANLLIGPAVTLDLSPLAGVKELQLRSEKNASVTSSAGGVYDYSSFVYLRTNNGVINIDDMKVYSWDSSTNTVDTNLSNGRAYILAKYAAVLNIRNSEISYLGSADGESYGIAWRDINDAAAPNVLRTRVTGEVIDSNIHHNYYGIYTFQASDLLFRGNQFHDNVRYGFDPHDYTHDVLVENNRSYNNGAHGFIISRGCNNFTFRNNLSYNNNDLDSVSQAHGFMLDPGSPNSVDPQAASYENSFVDNEAYGNEGYGLRILGSDNNQVIHNNFHNNQAGISLEGDSTGNTVNNNQFVQNTQYGVLLRDTATNNTVANNQINLNGSHGVYLRANANTLSGNSIQLNKADGISILPVSSLVEIAQNQILSNTIESNNDNGLDLRKAKQNLIQDNVINNNKAYGVYISDGSNQNSLLQNRIQANGFQGIRATGPQTYANAWSQNNIYANQLGGIAVTVGANAGLNPPILQTVNGQTVTGKSLPGATVEIFSDSGLQGQYYEGQTISAADGSFSFTAPGNWQGMNLTAVTIDSQGNASPFSGGLSTTGVTLPTTTPTPIGIESPTNTPTGTVTPNETVQPVPSETPSTTGEPPVYLPMIQK